MLFVHSCTLAMHYILPVQVMHQGHLVLCNQTLTYMAGNQSHYAE